MFRAYIQYFHYISVFKYWRYVFEDCSICLACIISFPTIFVYPFFRIFLAAKFSIFFGPLIRILIIASKFCGVNLVLRDVRIWFMTEERNLDGMFIFGPWQLTLKQKFNMVMAQMRVFNSNLQYNRTSIIHSIRRGNQTRIRKLFSSIKNKNKKTSTFHIHLIYKFSSYRFQRFMQVYAVSKNI